MTTDDSTGGSEDEASGSDLQAVVGIGTSADGLEALKKFFEGLVPRPKSAFLLVQHLAPDAESSLPRILQKWTSLEVETAEDGVPVRAGHVYVIPPDRELAVRDGRLEVDPLPELGTERRTIDHLFQSIARDYGSRSIGIVLSGASADGTEGLREIRERGGITMAQDPKEAGFPTMPRNAEQAGVVDFVLPAGELASRFDELVVSPLRVTNLGPEPDLDLEDRGRVERILELLREHTGHDFSEYKRPTLLRRIGRRMQVRRTESLEEYFEYLQSHPGERDALFEEVTITVTRFFRDPEIWEYFADEVVPGIFADKTPEDQVRGWVVGCSTGEEAYTVAMLLSEYADELARLPEIKIFATDIDESAVEKARAGNYSPAIAADAPAELLERYFYHEDDSFRVGKALRGKLLFAVHNALSDPPFRDLDFVTCRNLFIYLQPEAQERLLHLLHYGLRPGGYLVVGTSESTSGASQLFEEVDGERGVYLARGDVQSEIALGGTSFGFATEVEAHDRTATPPASRPDIESTHRSVVLDSHAPPSILVDEDYQLLHSIGDLTPFLSVPSGEATEDVLRMVPEEVRPRLRTMLFEAFEDDDRVTRRFPTVNGADTGEVEVVAKRVDAGTMHGPVVELSFHEQTEARSKTKDGEVEGSVSDAGDRDEVIAQLERELEQTRRRLRATIEEYEAANEKLRASNEELLSMNEELQSTTEELETSREELQSMNEELTTVNEELNEKIEELDQLNSDLKNLLRSTEIGTIFLNRDLEIQRFTETVTEYFNLRSSDIGRPLEHITHRLRPDELIESARRVLEEVTTVEVELTTEDGERHLLFRALPYLTVDDRVDGVVLTFVDLTQRKKIKDRLETSEAKFRTVFESAADAMFVYRVDADRDPRPFDDVNSRAVELTGYDRGELGEMTICEVLTGEEFDCEGHIERLARDGEALGEARLKRDDGRDPIPCEFRSKRMGVDGDQIVVEIVRDMRNRARYEEALERERERAEELSELRSVFLSTLSHDLQSPVAEIAAGARAIRDRLDGEPRERLDAIERATTRLRKILNRFLRRARVETNRAISRPSEFDLVEHVGELLELHETVAETAGKALRYEGPDSPLEVRLDPHLVRQVLNNLVEAALRNSDAEAVTLRLEEAGKQLRLEVRGIGEAAVGEADAETSGEEGLTVDSEIAVNELLVRSMGGAMRVERSDDGSSCAVVELPRRADRDAEA